MSTVGPLGGADGDLEAPIINAKKHQQRPPWEAVLEIWERPSSMLKNIDGGPLVPRGGSGVHPGSKRCFVILHGHDRQEVILLMGRTSLRLALLWLTTLSQFMRHG
jgi:hypothetical protein